MSGFDNTMSITGCHAGQHIVAMAFVLLKSLFPHVAVGLQHISRLTLNLFVRFCVAPTCYLLEFVGRVNKQPGSVDGLQHIAEVPVCFPETRGALIMRLRARVALCSSN